MKTKTKNLTKTKFRRIRRRMRRRFRRLERKDISRKTQIIGMGLILSIFIPIMISLSPTAKAISNTTMEKYLGHDFTEESWSVLFDVAGNYLEEDYDPGELEDKLDGGLNDNRTNVDSKFFIAYSNVDNVHSLYFALQNYSWGLDSPNTANRYGCSPYQLLIQQFRPYEGLNNIHHIVVNRFLGLMMYSDNKTDISDEIPDANDELYLGWSYMSEFHKNKVNRIFDANNIPDELLFDETEICKAAPISLSKDTVNGNTSYNFGMKYENVFIMWQKLSVEEGMDDGVDDIDILEKCFGFGLLEDITFRYKIVHADDGPSGKVKIDTVTEYDIGEFSQFWILGDNQTQTSDFNGEHYAITKSSKGKDLTNSFNIGYYNESVIDKRLTGNDETKGLGLAVINSAKHLAVDVDRKNDVQIEELYFQNEKYDDLENNTYEIDTAELEYQGDLIYEIDFASKPEYTVNGEGPYNAKSFSLEKGKFETDLDWEADWDIDFVISGSIGQISGSVNAKVYAETNVQGESLYYLTCFPKWNGGSIYNDPTFSVYVADTVRSEDDTTDDKSDQTDDQSDRRLPGYDIWIMLLSICSIVCVASVYLNRLNNRN